MAEWYTNLFTVYLVVSTLYVVGCRLGTLHLIDNAFVFEHSHLGFVYLPLEQLNRLQLFDEVRSSGPTENRNKIKQKIKNKQNKTRENVKYINILNILIYYNSK